MGSEERRGLDAGEATQRDVSASETTSIHLPPIGQEPLRTRQLTSEEASAIAALPFGSALLIAHSGPNAGARFLLDSASTTVGRHPNADIFLDDVTVSRDHAILVRRGEDYYLDDCGSLNGTYVNRRRIESHRLADGDELQVGKYKLAFLSR
jgi:pSer/pThr/pTyr-binding forkhead associated (FHA) protein